MSATSLPPLPSALDLAFEWVSTEAEPAISGSGGDDATFKTACMLVHGFGLTEGHALQAMAHYNSAKCSPAWSDHRLQHNVTHALNVPSQYPTGWKERKMLWEKGYRRPGAAPPRDEDPLTHVEPAPREEIEKVVFDYPTLAAKERRDWRVDPAWLRARSPVDPDDCTTAQFLDHVFRPGQFVMIFTKFASQGQFMYVVGKGFYRLAERPNVKAVRSNLPAGGPDGVWYLCSPITGLWLPNTRAPLDANGRVKQSRRIVECVTEFPYLVLECDHKEKACPCKVCNGRDNPHITELWLNFLAQLPLPITAIYTSAGKSIHAIIKVGASSAANWERWKTLIKELTVKCGADVAAMSAVRLTRLPGCLRNGKMQKLLYLNPSPDESGVPIGAGGVIRG
jgi:hypothetical protein